MVLCHQRHRVTTQRMHRHPCFPKRACRGTNQARRVLRQAHHPFSRTPRTEISEAELPAPDAESPPSRLGPAPVRHHVVGRLAGARSTVSLLANFSARRPGEPGDGLPKNSTSLIRTPTSPLRKTWMTMHSLRRYAMPLMTKPLGPNDSEDDS